MGAAVSRITKAAIGKSLVQVNTIQGHSVWAPSYDAGPNPLVALEKRVLADRLTSAEFNTFVDVGCGTGRWMHFLRQNGSQAFGMDLCREMLLQATGKLGLTGRLGLADAARLPIADSVADLVLCSFTFGYVRFIGRAMAEMARIARHRGRVIVSDVHPCALASGWKRSFRSNGVVYEIAHHVHPASVWESAAESAGLTLQWRIDARFGEAEREIFRQAGKDAAFDTLSAMPALLAMCWMKP